MTELTYEIEADILEDLQRQALDEALATLPPRGERIIRGYFAIGTLPVTVKELADEFGYTRERIHQLKKLALVRLAEFMQDWENDTPTTPEERRRNMTVVHQKDKQTGYYRFEQVWS
jgi:DNA-directed RNA polymerase sigma subunit (sigma70/sigma32)